MSKFKVGDKVKVIIDKTKDRFCGHDCKIGMVGIIKYIRDDDKYAVEFPKKFSGGHNCCGHTINGQGQWLKDKDLELVIDFKVGDRVQFKTWEEMEKEYGITTSDSINIFPAFTTEMKYLCGTYATIESFYDNKVYLKDFTAKGDIAWSYCIEMIKPVEVKQEKPPKNLDNSDKLTDIESEILSKLDKKFRYIARDANDCLFIYIEKPVIDIGGQQWYSTSYYQEVRPKNLFKSIKWGDDPVEIEILKGGK